MAADTSKVEVTLAEHRINLPSLNVIEAPPTSFSLQNPPRNGSPNLGQSGTRLVPAVPHDATTTPSSESGMSYHPRRPRVVLWSRSLVVPYFSTEHPSLQNFDPTGIRPQ
jgi:hypothetical protein